MRSISCPRVATCVVVAALASAPAVILPSIARADDGTAAAADLATATGVAAPDAVLPAEDDAAAVVDAALATALDSGPTATAPADVADEVQTTAEPEPDTVEAPQPASATPSAGSSVLEPVSETDTTAGGADTTPDTASSSPVRVAAPVAVQTAPTNVNVSVRIASAGDNGPVTQTNVAASVAIGATSGPTAPASGTTSTTGAFQTPATPTAAAPLTAPAAAAEDDIGTWSWQWDCVSVPAISMVSPGGSSNASVPRNWTWLWNCGSNPGQYQGATAVQYQPSNVNVEIRIASPGNDGPVSQANVAFAVSAGASVPHGASTPVASTPPTAVPVPIPLPVVSLPGIPALPGLSAIPAVLSPIVPSLVEPSSESGVAELVPPELAPLLDGLDGLLLVTPPTVGTGDVSPWASLVPRRPPFRARLDASSGAPTPAPATAWRGIGGVAQSSRSVERATEAPDAKREKPAPRWRRPAPTAPAPAQAPPGTSAAAASGGGSSGGGLPLFLALPFVVAMLDLARRTALERVASPSGHRSRMPENPG